MQKTNKFQNSTLGVPVKIENPSLTYLSRYKSRRLLAAMRTVLLVYQLLMLNSI